jgi:RNA polymerase sigma factor (sigma-70 family)
LENLAADEIHQLVERCKAGDMPGCKQLYQRYAKAMYNTCLRILNNVQEAEDVLQESFMEAFKNLNRFEQRTSFGGWLKQICINRSINQLKKRRVSFVDVEQSSVHEIAAVQSQDETDMMMKVAAVKNNMMKLPDGYRAVLSLYLLEGYDHEEIAGILQVAESTVRSQYIRAKQKLLQLLNKEYEQAGKIY